MTPVGDTKMPDPIMVPATIEIPLQRPRERCKAGAPSPVRGYKNVGLSSVLVRNKNALWANVTYYIAVFKQGHFDFSAQEKSNYTISLGTKSA